MRELTKLKKIKGVTLIEIMIVVAILGIAFYGIFRLFKYAYDAWWLGSSKLSLQQDAREAMYWIANDFKKSKRSSVGNLVANTGFEYPIGLWGVEGWDSLGGGVYKVSNQENVRSGFYAVKLCDIVNYKSNPATPFTFPYTGNYIVSGWIFNSNTAAPVGNAEIRLMQPGEVDLAPPVFLSVATTGYWRYLTASFTQNQGTNFIVRLNNLQAGTTVYFDDISVSPQTFTFNMASASDMFFGYGKTAEAASPGNLYENYRLHFSTGSVDIPYRHILRERQSPPYTGTWIPENPIPLCRKVESVTITDYNQEYFKIDLTLFDPEATGTAGQQRYNLSTQVWPNMP